MYAKYGRFSIADEQAQYRLEVSSYSGTAGDSFIAGHNNMAFSTKDRDNDRISSLKVLCDTLALGGTTVATTPILTENIWETRMITEEHGGHSSDVLFHSNSLK